MNINLYKKFLTILFIISALVLFIGCNICTNSESPEVTFEDINFENAIRDILEKPDDKITEDDMLGITNLPLGYREIENISGIEHCKNLQTLDLQYNNISDISKLSDLNQLWFLRLRNNSISDIKSVSSLRKLKELLINNNKVHDLSAVSNLNEIVKLYLFNNQISDIRPIVQNTGFKNGGSIELRNNPLSSISIYSYIPKLQNRGIVVHYNKSTLFDTIE